MYLRHTTYRKDGKLHRYWQLVRAVRSAASRPLIASCKLEISEPTQS